MAVTLKNIAKETNLSVATVSLAIRGKSAGKFSLAPETVEYVQQTAQRLGYRANGVAASLSSRSTKVIGVLISALHGDFYEKILDGIEHKISPDFIPLLGVHNYDSARERKLLESFISNRVDGVLAVFSSFPENIELYKEMKDKFEIPIIMVDRGVPGLNIPLVKSNHFELMYQATKAMLDLGHKKVHMVTAVGCLEPERHKEGYYKAMRDAGYCEDIRVMASPYFNGWHKSGLRKFANEVMHIWQALSNRATAFVVQNDWLAYEMLSECQLRGINVPGDLSIMGIDDCLPSSIAGIELSSVAQMPKRIGIEAASRLLSIINKEETAEGDTLLPVEVILRKTTGKPQGNI